MGVMLMSGTTQTLFWYYLHPQKVLRRCFASLFHAKQRAPIGVAAAINYFYALIIQTPEEICQNICCFPFIAPGIGMPYPCLCANRMGTKLAGPQGNHPPE
jgi:hypothetical protein